MERTDAEIDFLLERFDQTAPDIQRRIVAKFADDRERLLTACKKFAENWKAFCADDGVMSPFDFPGFDGVVDGILAAINNAEAH